MKSFLIALAAFAALFATSAFAQSDSRAAFEKLKSLEGSWAGKGSQGQPIQVTFRVTSNGSAIMSEIEGSEDMISMIHLDGDRLMLTHYCATGNQPRMVGKMTPDGKTVAFDFLDVTNFNRTQPGHMQHVVLTMLDANHHTEDWSFMTQDGKVQEHELFDLQRKK
jgi:hypothetical protein